MKCYRCNNELNDDDKECPKCGSKVIKLNKRKKVEDNSYKYEYFGLSISALITKLFSLLLSFLSVFNLIFPWLLLSLVFALVGYFKYKDKRNIKLIIIDLVLIIGEILLIIIFFKKFINLF